MTNLAGIVWDALTDHADRAGVRQGARVLTYGELAQAARQVASLLWGEGVRPGARLMFAWESAAAEAIPDGWFRTGAAFARERVAACKYPRRVWLVDQLPKGPTGKILRRSVKPPS